jgi:hypothetical protein
VDVLKALAEYWKRVESGEANRFKSRETAAKWVARQTSHKVTKHHIKGFWEAKNIALTTMFQLPAEETKLITSANEGPVSHLHARTTEIEEELKTLGTRLALLESLYEK